MLNLKEVITKYQKRGLIDIIRKLGWGSKVFYYINSDVPINLNRETFSGFITNENGELEEFDIIKEGNPLNLNYTWGKTIDKYFPHPWYPDKKIKSFKVLKLIPGFGINESFSIKEGHIKGEYSNMSINDCLANPEFFKPQYEEEVIR